MVWSQILFCIWVQIFVVWYAEKILKSDSNCQSYSKCYRGTLFRLAVSCARCAGCIYKVVQQHNLGEVANLILRFLQKLHSHNSERITSFKVKWSKIKVTRPTNTENGSASYLPNWKTYEFKTWYTAWSMKSRISGSAKVKGHGDEVTWSVCQVLAHKSRTKSPRNSKIGR